MLRRRVRSLRAFGVRISLPSKVIEPLVGVSRPLRHRAVVVLPQPDSPTSPTISPGAMSKKIPSTARKTGALLRRPSRYILVSSRTRRMGSPIGPPGVFARQRQLACPVAGGRVTGPSIVDGIQCWQRLGADIDGVPTAGPEGAPVDPLAGTRWLAGNLREARRPGLPDAGYGGEQPSTVRVPWPREQGISGRGFNNAAGVHHHGGIGEALHDTDVVAD